MKQAFGRDRKKSEKISARLIESASAHGMSILVHVGMRRYGDFISEMINFYPYRKYTFL